MDERESFRNLWVSIGAAMLIGGYIASTDWLFTVRAASPARNLTSFSWPLLVPGVFVLIGLYVIVAALSPTKWMPLPGKARVKHRQEQRKCAEYFVSVFHARALMLATQSTLTTEEIAEFSTPLQRYVISAWGLHESAAFMSTENMNDNKAMMWGIRDDLQNLALRCRLIPVESDFSWTKDSPWISYCRTFVRSDTPYVND